MIRYINGEMGSFFTSIHKRKTERKEVDLYVHNVNNKELSLLNLISNIRKTTRKKF